MSGSRRFLLSLFLCAVAVGGCASRKGNLENLYARLKEEPRALDTSVLAGRRIVIDPGHGGSFNGAVGADSLREADANLGVALYLWGLCKDAGADAQLTRTADRDYLPPGSTEVGDDLKARVAKANELDPDVFLSIHHNSNLPLNRDVNKIEVYYRSSDPNASLELAEELQVHLARNLGIETSEVRPGTYAVLRLSTARAAVIGEASYLSSPPVEERLKLSAKQKLEAEAYFLGLVSYFARGVPTVTRLAPATDSLTSPGEIAFSVQSAAGVPIDPSSVRLAIGATQEFALFDPSRGVLRSPMDARLANGTYTVQATVRSMGGASASSKPYVLLLARPARHIIPLEPRPKPASIVAFSIAVLDGLASPVADGTPVTVASRRGGTTFSGRTTRGVFEFEAARDLARERFIVATPGLSDTVRFPSLDEKPSLPLLVIDARSEEAVPAPVVSWGSLESATGDSKGRVLVPAPGQRDTLVVTARGYRIALLDSLGARAASPPIRARLEPLFAGALRGKRVAIDPGGGGTDPGGRGANGLRGAWVNLAVARHLRDLLERSGAEVTLTREGDESISPQERVFLVNRFEPDLAVGVRHDKPPASLGESRAILRYPASRGGMLLSEKLVAALPGLPGAAFPVKEWASLLLQQTACPACEVYCGPIDDKGMEAAMGNESWQRLEAEKIFAAVANYFGCGGCIRESLALKVVMNGAPVPGATVDIDQLLTRSTDAEGLAVFGFVEKGPRLVAVRTKDGRRFTFERDLSPNESGELVLELR